jgi:hypothetical protein
MRQKFMFLSIFILGPHILSRNINVYLQPLIDELKYVWLFKALKYDVTRKKNSNECSFDVDYK